MSGRGWYVEDGSLRPSENTRHDRAYRVDYGGRSRRGARAGHRGSLPDSPAGMISQMIGSSNDNGITCSDDNGEIWNHTDGPTRENSAAASTLDDPDGARRPVQLMAFEKRGGCIPRVAEYFCRGRGCRIPPAHEEAIMMKSISTKTTFLRGVAHVT